MRDAIWVYDNWSAYTDGVYEEAIWGAVDDKTRLNEELSLQQLREIVRLKEQGVHFDYYMMNAFWFDPEGAYRKWRQPDWPQGPDRWIEGCLEHGIKPGLWFGTNSLWKIHAAPKWRDSLAVQQPGQHSRRMSLYEGGFLADFMEVLEHWYGRGIRLFEFDAAHFDAATERALKTQTPPEEIFSRNRAAFSDALKDFRSRHPDARLAAFNDFGGDILSTATPFPFKKPVDLRWLEVFDTLYTGDIRVSDVPMVNFWRSVDLFNDHMTRRYEQSGVPLERADPFFTLSSTWFGYHREKRAWKSMLLLSAARGSWKKTVYGDLTLLDEEDGRFFAKVQQMYATLGATGQTKTFGGIPGEVSAYGYCSYDAEGALYTAVNPAQAVRTIELPKVSLYGTRLLFRDDGFVPHLESSTLVLGPEQMALVGLGRYADSSYDLGIEPEVIIPREISPVPAKFSARDPALIETNVVAPQTGDLRVLVWQRAADGTAPRSRYLKIAAEQKGRPLTVSKLNQERAISTGISWAAGEIRGNELDRGAPVAISCSSPEKEAIVLSGEVYVVEYGHTE